MTAPRANLLPVVSLAVALLSFAAAGYQGWLNTRNLDIIQRDIERREHLRACKEAIEAMFDARLKVALLAESGAGRPAALAAVARIGALGTYLANFEGEATRVRYTELTRELTRVVAAAAQTAPADVEALFGRADALFAGMNEDCVRSARHD